MRRRFLRETTFCAIIWRNIVNRRTKCTLAFLACTALGTTAISGLYAQNKSPGAYVIVDISEISNPDGFKQLLPKAPAAVAAFGGQFVTRTEQITALDGTPPKRFVIIGFESVDKAKAWSASAAQKEVDAIRIGNTKSRSFIVATEGM
jgi:uncharacterized protein (DUF1330 family)